MKNYLRKNSLAIIGLLVGSLTGYLYGALMGAVIGLASQKDKKETV